MKVLASANGIPFTGAASLLRDDPLTQGPKIFSRNCASCHRYDGHDATGQVPKDPQTAPDLKDFGTRQWIAGMLEPGKVDSLHYFGGTKFKDGRMVRYVKRDIPKFTPEQNEELRQIVMAVSGEANLKAQVREDARDAELIQKGRALFHSESMRCGECHVFHKADEDVTGPDLTGYASRQWLIDFISNPAHARFYGKRNDRMPKFSEDKVLSPKDIELVADWLRGDWAQAQ